MTERASATHNVLLHSSPVVCVLPHAPPPPTAPRCIGALCAPLCNGCSSCLAAGLHAPCPHTGACCSVIQVGHAGRQEHITRKHALVGCCCCCCCWLTRSARLILCCAQLLCRLWEGGAAGALLCLCLCLCPCPSPCLPSAHGCPQLLCIRLPSPGLAPALASSHHGLHGLLLAQLLGSRLRAGAQGSPQCVQVCKQGSRGRQGG
jgi:hypothetical protein